MHLKPFSQEAKQTYNFRVNVGSSVSPNNEHQELDIDDKKDMNKRIDNRPSNNAKQFYFIKEVAPQTEETKKIDVNSHNVFLLDVEREFPTISLFQPLVKYEKYSFKALEYYTREIQTIIQ